MRVAVAGTGYVGLVTGVVLAHLGHNVTCVDIDEEKINKMRIGISPIYEKGLEELMKLNSSRITYTTDYKRAYKDAEVIFIGVGTPERVDGSANLDYVFGVAKQIADSLENDAVVVVKSTVPIGTNDKVEAFIRQNLKHGIHVDVASNPEFLAQGTAVKDTLYASRIVVGVETERANQIMQKLYEPLQKEPYNVPYLVMNRASAEMVKYASNDFLALKISYINEIANLCEKLNANIEDVTQGMGFDSRIGNKFLKAGIGYGGSCFPKDTKALHWLGKQSGIELKTIKAAIEVNKEQKIKMFEVAKEVLNGNFENKEVAVLGATFKPGTDDLRESPSVDNIRLLLEYGANITVYDPIGLDNLKKIFKDQVIYNESLEETLLDKDMAFIMTEWPSVLNLDPNLYVKYMKRPLIFDGRNCYDLSNISQIEEIEYYSVGRQPVKNNQNIKKLVKHI